MKIVFLKFALYHLFLPLMIVGILGVALSSCSKDEDPLMPFENSNDFVTEAIESTIPRLELFNEGGIVRAYLSVTDQEGTPLSNFTIRNFEIMEVIGNDTIYVTADMLNNGNQDISEPLAVSANMDYSGSMSPFDIDNMEDALVNFVKQKDDTDIMSIIKFGSYVKRVQDFTTDSTLLLSKIFEYSNVGTYTAFYDACDMGLEDLNELNSGYLPVVIGFTDGYNNSSYQTQYGLMEKALDYDIPIYSIGFGSADHGSLTTISEATGGRYFYAPSGEDIADLYSLLNNQLKKLYVFQWPVNTNRGETVYVIIRVEYTAAKGTFEDLAFRSYQVN